MLGPVLFSLYLVPLGKTLHSFGIYFHCNADDLQLYLAVALQSGLDITKLHYGVVDYSELII